MKKSAHEVWRIAKEQKLNDEETKALLKKEGIIVNYEALKAQHEIAERIQNRIKNKNMK